MTTQEIAQRLVELCRKGDYETAYTELYSKDIVSHEMSEYMSGTLTGLDAVMEKAKKWGENIVTMHSTYTNDAVVAPGSFACVMGFDADFKTEGRMKGDELAVYKVKDGKIVEEWFFA